jgi:hypothetical protein
MIVEQEVIEQIAEEKLGRPLSWVCDLIRSLGREDVFVVLHGLWRAGYVALVDDNCHPLPQWRCAELFRAEAEPSDAHLVVTDLGQRWGDGP